MSADFPEHNEQIERDRDLTRSVRWETSKDDKVCPICGMLQGKVFPRNLAPQLPLHKHCRCKYEAVDMESHYHKGYIYVGDGESIFNQFSIGFLEGIMFRPVAVEEGVSDAQVRMADIRIAARDQRVRNSDSVVRLRSIASIKKSYQRYKMLAVETQNMQGLKFGMQGRKLANSRSIVGKERDVPRSKVADNNNSAENVKAATVIRRGIALELERILQDNEINLGE